MANAASTRPVSRARPAECPAMPLSARPTSRHTYAHPPPADADIGKIARRTRVRGVAVGPAVQ